MPGTFVSAAGGTFETVMPGTFHSATGGTFETVLGGTIKPLPSNLTCFSGKSLFIQDKKSFFQAFEDFYVNKYFYQHKKPQK